MERSARFVSLFVVGFLLTLRSTKVAAIPIQTDFYTFGTASDSELHHINGAGLSSQANLSVGTFNFYGDTYSSILVDSNGILILESTGSSIQHIPEEFPIQNRIIAPFWAKAAYNISYGHVYYRVDSSATLLLKMEREIDLYFQKAGITQDSVSLTKLVIVTWNDLRSETNHNRANTFQCILGINSSTTFILFHYADGLMSWGGGSSPALVGFNKGDGITSLVLPTSLTDTVLEIASTGNTGLNGKWFFVAGGSKVIFPGAIIGFSEVQYSTSEMMPVTICTKLMAGSLVRDATLIPISTHITTSDNDFTTRGVSFTFYTTSAINNVICSRLTIENDIRYEFDEIFSIRLSTFNEELIAFLPQRTTITIIDDDIVFVTYDSLAAVEENLQVTIPISFKATTNGPSLCNNLRPQRDVQVSYTVFDGDAKNGLDYVGGNGTLTIHANQCKGNFTVMLLDDSTFEEREHFSYAIRSSNPDIVVDSSHSSANVYLTDRDGRSVVVGLTQNQYTVNEGDQLTICTQMIAGYISQPLVVTIQHGHSFQMHRATVDQDFLPLREDLTFVPSNPRAIECVNFITLNDTIYESTESRPIVLTSNSNITLQPKSALIKILDSNSVTIRIEKDSYIHKEGTNNRLLQVCAFLTGVIERNLNVSVIASEGSAKFFNSNFMRNGDFRPNINDIMFEVPRSSSSRNCVPHCTACTQITIQDDAILEVLHENFSLVLSHDDPAVHLTTVSAMVTIVDNDNVQITIQNAANLTMKLKENEEVSRELCLDRNGLSDIDVSVQITTKSNTAINNVDYIIVSETVTIPASLTQHKLICGHIRLKMLDDPVVEGDEMLEIFLKSTDPSRVFVWREDSPEIRTVTIIDDDNVSVSFLQSSFDVNEGEGGVLVCLQMTGFAAIPLTVLVTPWPDTAIAGFDYVSSPVLFQFPPTDQTLLNDTYNLAVPDRLLQPLPVSPPLCANIPIIDDDIVEIGIPKVLQINVSYDSSMVVFAPPVTATVTIEDDDNAVVYLEAHNLTVLEGDSIQICAKMLGRAVFAIRVRLRPVGVPSSAQGGVDFIADEQFVEFPAFSSEHQCVWMQSINDSIVESDEQFYIELALVEEYSNISLSSNQSAYITIVDNDVVEVGFERTEYSINEGEGSVEVCANMTGRLDTPVSVIFSTQDPLGRNQGNEDYDHIQSLPLFEALSTDEFRRQCVPISITNDTILEDTEEFKILLTSTDASVRVVQNVSTVYILDDDSVRVSLASRAITISESEGLVSSAVCVILAGRIQQDIELTLETEPRSAKSGSDYIPISTTLTFVPATVSEQRQCIDVSVIDDSTFEDDEEFVVLLRKQHAAVSLHISQMTILISDDDSVILSLSNSEERVVEGEGGVNVCVGLSGSTDRNVSYQLDVQSTEAMADSDFSSSFPSVFTFPISTETQQTQCHRINIIDDNVLEATERFEVRLRALEDVVSLGTNQSLSITIVDNDFVEVGFESTDYFISEGEGSVEVCASMTGRLDRPVSIIFSTLDSPEINQGDEDYDHIQSLPLFEALSTDEFRRQCVTISITNDTILEDTEEFQILLTSTDASVRVVQNISTVYILDDDSVSVGLERSEITVSESDGLDSSDVCVLLEGRVQQEIEVTLETQPRSAEGGRDYIPVSTTLTFVPATVSEQRQCIDVSVIDDNTLEDDEEFVVLLREQHMAVNLLTSQMTIMINDDDSVILSLLNSEEIVDEEEGEVNVCVQLSGSTERNVTYQLDVQSSEAMADLDFSWSFPSFFTFPISTETQQTQCHQINIIDDNILEATERFEVRLQALEDVVSLGTNQSLSITIVDNDFVEVGFERTDYSIIEGEGNVEVCANMTGRLDKPVSVIFSTSDSLEINQGDLDYVHIQSLALFQDPTTDLFRRECVNISIINDNSLENTETFQTRLTSSDAGIEIVQRSSTVYILDDDSVTISLESNQIAVSESERLRSAVCVLLEGQIQQEIEVTLETQPRSAESGSDYIPISTTLTFVPATVSEQRQCINVSVIDDSTFEDDEEFVVLLSEQHEAVSLHISQMTILINDDDSVILSLSNSEESVAEEVGRVNICVELYGSMERNVSYHLEVQSAEAMANLDFSSSFPSLFIFPISSNTQQTQCHQISIIDDNILEATEHFKIKLQTLEGVARIHVDTKQTTVGIYDNDNVTIGFVQTEFSVAEDVGDREVSVCMRLEGEIGRKVLVSVRSQPGTAGPDDFVMVMEDVTFSPAGHQSLCFLVFVQPDKFVEMNETFSLSISSIDTAVGLTASIAVVTITDNDVVCKKTSMDTSRGYFSWPETYPEEAAIVVCENGTATRFCAADGEWNKPNPRNCYVSAEELFRYIGKHGFNEHNLRELLFAILQLFAEMKDPSLLYMRIVDSTLEQFAEQVEADKIVVNTEIFEILLKIVDNLHMWPAHILQRHSSNVILSQERISIGLFKKEEFSSYHYNLNETSFFSIKSHLSALLPKDKSELKLSFGKDAAGKSFILIGEQTEKTVSSIVLPHSITGKLEGTSLLGLFVSYYDNNAMFPVNVNETDTEVNITTSAVLAASFSGMNLHDLPDDVIITINLGTGNYTNITCVSWDFEQNEGEGSWSEEGCELVDFKENIATCSCSHLTNFACLVNIEARVNSGYIRNPSVKLSLSILSIIGGCVSILGLVLTIITLLVFNKLRKRDTTVFRLQLCVAMILMLVSFLVGMDRVEIFGVCVLASALIHYFTLASVLWMAAEAVLMVQKLVFVFSQVPTSSMVIISLICWLLPIPPVVIPIIIDRSYTISDDYCFISNVVVFFSAFLGPIFAVLLFNFVMFLIVISVVISHRCRRFKDISKTARRKGACRSLFSILGLMCLFGLTWVFAAFTVKGASSYFEFLFVIFNCFQGFYIFMFFVVFAKETRDLWLQTCGCKKKKKRETMTSAILASYSKPLPRSRRVTLDDNAERLKTLEDVDNESRKMMNSWDIAYIMPQSQFNVFLSSNGMKRQDNESELKEPDFIPMRNFEPRQPKVKGKIEEEEDEMGRRLIERVPSAISLDSTQQNALESLSTADSGILMDKPKCTPSPTMPEGEWPHHHLTPVHHVHSVSGTEYASNESSLEPLLQREQDCCYVKEKTDPVVVELSSQLIARAIPNDYARLNVEKV